MNLEDSIKFYNKMINKYSKNLNKSKSVSQINEMFQLQERINNSVFHNYLIDIQNNALSYNVAIKNFVYINEMLKKTDRVNKVINNDIYTDTLKICFNDILNSNINLSELEIDNDIVIDDVEYFKKFNETDKKLAIDAIEEITKKSKGKNINLQQKIKKTVDKFKEKNPVIAYIITFVFTSIFSVIIGNLFTTSSKEVYIQNYITNNNIVVLDTTQDFIDNGRYVNANTLKVRKGPGKEFELVYTLSFDAVTKVVDKTKYWTKIEYINESNNQKEEGWVYTRYLKSFDENLLLNDND